MSAQIKTDELLDIIKSRIDPNMGKVYERVLQTLSNDMAQIVYEHLPAHTQVKMGEANYQFGSMMVPFTSAIPGQTVPDILDGCDNDGWFDTQAAE